MCPCHRAVEAAFELGRTNNPSGVAHERRSKLAKARKEAVEKAEEFDHWAAEAEKHIQHKVRVARCRGFRCRFVCGVVGERELA